MRLSEILCETTDEDVMLDNIAEKIVEHLFNQKTSGTVGTIGSITRDMTFPTKFLDTEIVIRNLVATHGDTRSGVFTAEPSPTSNHALATDRSSAIELFYKSSLLSIAIDPSVIKEGNASGVKSTLVHELRHLLDFVKSKAKDSFGKKTGNTKYASAGKDTSSEFSNYHSSKSEINARTQQAMLSLKELIDEHGLTSISTDNLAQLVHRCLYVQHVRRYFPAGTRGDTEYRRVFNRLVAYATRYLTVE